MYTLRCTFYEPAHMETVLKSFRALSCILLSKAPRRFTCLWARFWSSKATFLNWESRPISVDPVRFLVYVTAARCVCVPICFISGIPGLLGVYLQNWWIIKHRPKQKQALPPGTDIFKERHSCSIEPVFWFNMFPSSLMNYGNCVI